MARAGLAALLFVTLPLAGCATTRAPDGAAPSAGAALLAEAIDVLRTRPLGAARVDWTAVHASVAPSLPANATTRDAWPAIEAAVAELHDPHARFITADAHRAWRTQNAAPAQAATPAPPAGRIPVQPEGSMLPGGAAYLVVPTCATGEPAQLQAFALQLRSLVLQLADHNPRGWIVDLRFNAGGNVWPMLVGLRPLLGDGVLATSITPAGRIFRLGCDQNSAWLDDGSGPAPQLRIDPPPADRLLHPARVAVLIHHWTMSSGEVVASAFHAAPNARLFGSSSAGLTTATEFVHLSDDSILNLPTSRMADRYGHAFHGPIEPWTHVASDAWPSPDDAVTNTARAWLLDTFP